MMMMIQRVITIYQLVSRTFKKNFFNFRTSNFSIYINRTLIQIVIKSNYKHIRTPDIIYSNRLQK
jgi:hypothetical protein